MEAKIIAAIGRRDDIGAVIQCLENLTRPGMTLVFLFRYPLDFWPYIRGHWVTTESVSAAMNQGRELLARYSWENQRNLAEGELAAVREALGEKGVEVDIDFYTGSLKEALLKYSADPAVFWVVRPSSTGRICARFLDRIGLFRSTHLARSWSLCSVAYRKSAYMQVG